MNTRFARQARLWYRLLVCLGLVVFCATMAHAQSAGTGAIYRNCDRSAGPRGSERDGDDHQSRNRPGAHGDHGRRDGDYKFSLLPPGNYRPKFTAAGFKTGEVSSVTVDVTETPTANEALEVGTVNQTVTVESNVKRCRPRVRRSEPPLPAARSGAAHG